MTHTMLYAEPLELYNQALKLIGLSSGDEWPLAYLGSESALNIQNTVETRNCGSLGTTKIHVKRTILACLAHPVYNGMWYQQRNLIAFIESIEEFAHDDPELPRLIRAIGFLFKGRVSIHLSMTWQLASQRYEPNMRTLWYLFELNKLHGDWSKWLIRSQGQEYTDAIHQTKMYLVSVSNMLNSSLDAQELEGIVPSVYHIPNLPNSQPERG